jgi:hypothetical protein
MHGLVPRIVDTAEAIALRRQLSELIRMARVILAELKERR